MKNLLSLSMFFMLLMVGSGGEMTPAAEDPEKGIEHVTKLVFPSVVRVEAINNIKKVATGVIIDKEGYIVTTALISPRDEEILVTTSEGRKSKAEFLGFDPETHLALIKVKEKSLTAIEMARGESLFPGTWIAVISISPENTAAVTQGIVSSVAEDKLRLNVWVTPGTSGSPVVNKEGKMVGLLRGIYSDERPVIFEFREKEVTGAGYVLSKAEAPSSGMALAIPVDVVNSVTSDIRRKGKVERGWLGISIAENEEGKVEIMEVAEKSPAELARLQRGDIVLQIEGREVISSLMLASEIRKRKPGQDVTLKIERGGKTMDIKVKLDEYSPDEARKDLERKFPSLFPPQFPSPPSAPRQPETWRRFWSWEKRKYIGVYLEEINRELSEYFGVKEGTGLLVTKVSAGSPAETAGLKVGDVIIRVNNVRVERINRLTDLIQEKKRGDKVKVEFIREKKSMTAEVEVGEEERRFWDRGFFDQQEWLDYIESWGKYREELNKELKKWQDEYRKGFQEKMKKVNEEISTLVKELAGKSQKEFKELKGLFRNVYIRI